MASLAPKILRFRPSLTEDVRGYFVRVLPASSVFKYDLPAIDVGDVPPDGDGFVRVDLTTFSETEDLDGRYDVYVTAYDDNQPVPNESDPLLVPDAAFDFSAPDAPTDGAVES